MAAQPAMQPVLAKRPQDDRPTPISIKVLLCVSVVLLAAVLYNAMGGGWQATRGRRSGRIHEATLPLQKRPRKSKYAHTADEDEPDQVVVPTNATAAAECECFCFNKQMKMNAIGWFNAFDFTSLRSLVFDGSVIVVGSVLVACPPPPGVGLRNQRPVTINTAIIDTVVVRLRPPSLDVRIITVWNDRKFFLEASLPYYGSAVRIRSLQ